MLPCAPFVLLIAFSIVSCLGQGDMWGIGTGIYDPDACKPVAAADVENWHAADLTAPLQTKTVDIAPYDTRKAWASGDGGSDGWRLIPWKPDDASKTSARLGGSGSMYNMFRVTTTTTINGKPDYQWYWMDANQRCLIKNINFNTITAVDVKSWGWRVWHGKKRSS